MLIAPEVSRPNLVHIDKKDNVDSEIVWKTFLSDQIKQTKDNGNSYNLHNRRYIGSKYKLLDWIFTIIQKECTGNTFLDIFAGTGVVSSVACKIYKKTILNDFLYSNEVVFNAFFSHNKWSTSKIQSIISEYNAIDGCKVDDNYVSQNFGGKYFSYSSAKKIGEIRERIETSKNILTFREYNILLASLLYSVDKIANTVGHYDAYFKKRDLRDELIMRPIKPVIGNKISIHRKDANYLAKSAVSDITYIDPPYNSRQYSRFYHLLETLTKWDKPELHGVALKPPPENMSDYCRVSAASKFQELVNDLDSKFLIVSYNNTYEPKSTSSLNKISLKEIFEILSTKGPTKIFKKNHPHFNAGNTHFSNHKEYLFVTTNTNE